MTFVYYKTPKISETGKKFQALLDRAEEIKEKITAFCKGQGGTGFCVRTYISEYAFGTYFTGIEFSETPSPEIWEPYGIPTCYRPNRRTKKGREIAKKIDEIPKITIEEVNAIIKHQEDKKFNSLRYEIAEDYFGFIVNVEWTENVPADCKKIKYIEYQKLSLKE